MSNTTSKRENRQGERRRLRRALKGSELQQIGTKKLAKVGRYHAVGSIRRETKRVGD